MICEPWALEAAVAELQKLPTFPEPDTTDLRDETAFVIACLRGLEGCHFQGLAWSDEYQRDLPDAVY